MIGVPSTNDAGWRSLIEAFAAGRIDGPSFERRFLALWRADIARGESPRHAVDLLFYEVDAYCDDPALRGEQDIDEEELRRQARLCLSRWHEPWPPTG